MRNTEYRKFKAHIYNYLDPQELKDTIKTYKKLRESNGTIWGAVQTMVQYGVFDVYHSQVIDTLKHIYGDDFKESVYFTKNGDYREKNNETYCWTVYKNKICRTIETMIKKGELDLKDN